MPIRRNQWAWAAVALIAGAGLRTAFIVHHPRIAGDALVYGDLAHNLLAHHSFGLTEETIRPTLIRLPGYPLFLAACFALFGNAHYLPVLWIQGIVDLVSCCLLARLAARVWGRRAGLATLWLSALCPFTANYTAVAITETLSLFCVVLAFYALERWRAAIGPARRSRTEVWTWAMLLGAALAGAVLLRPDQGLLAAAVLPCVLWAARPGLADPARRTRLSATAAVAIFALPLLLWGMRNWRVFHVVQPLAPRYATDPGEPVPYGFQRWYRTWAIDFQSSLDTYWKYDGESLSLPDLPARAFDSPAQKAATAAVYRLYNSTQAASPEVDAAFGRLAGERVAAHPFRYYVELPLGRELNMWLRPRTELMKLPVDWWLFRHPLGSAVALVYGLLNAAYLLLAVRGLTLWRRAGWPPDRPYALAMLGFVVLRCALLLTVDNSEPRYTLECFPVLFLLGGFVFGLRNKTARAQTDLSA